MKDIFPILQISAATILIALLSSACTDEGSNNSLPEIGITSPAHKSVFKAGEEIAIRAFATGANGKVARMEFYEGTTKLGEDPIAPYEYIWGNVKTGNYTLSITTIDGDGSENGSASITVEVVNP